MSLEKLLVFSDPHAPFHSRRGMELFYQVAQWWKPFHMVCLGDLMDAHSISFHSKDPARKLNLEDEVGEAKTILDNIDAVCGKGRKIYTAGNHENRLERYIADKAPALFGLVTIPGILDLKARGWQYVPYRQHTRIGKLYLTHDVGFAGRYATSRTLDAIQHSVATGHTHRFSLLVEGNILGESRVSASFGWLGEVKDIDYTHSSKALKDWQLGFGLGYHDPATGHVTLVPVPLLPRGKGLECVVEGKAFRA